MSKSYTKLLTLAIDNPGKVIFGTIVTLAIVQIGYSQYGGGIYFFPPQEPDSATLSIHARGNLSIQEQDHLLSEVERQVLELEGIKFIYAKTGRPPGAGANAPTPDFIGDIQVELLPWNSRKPAEEILNTIESRVSAIPGINVLIQKEGNGPTLGQAVQIEVASKDSDALLETVDIVRQGMSEAGGFASIADNRPLPGIAMQPAAAYHA